MIAGKTIDQRWAEAQAWKPAYASLPVSLSDGRWIWRENYFYRDSCEDWRGGRGIFTMPFRQRVLEVPEGKHIIRHPDWRDVSDCPKCGKFIEHGHHECFKAKVQP